MPTPPTWMNSTKGNMSLCDWLTSINNGTDSEFQVPPVGLFYMKEHVFLRSLALFGKQD